MQDYTHTCVDNPNLKCANPYCQGVKQTERQQVLELQTISFETLVSALNRLEARLHRQYMIGTLSIMLDVPNLHLLPTISLAELLFALLDSCTEARAIMNQQNVLIYVTDALERGIQ